MKSPRLPILLALALAPLPFLLGKDIPKEPDELERIRQTYLQRRTDALKPVNTWYQAQLDALQKKFTQTGNLDAALAIRHEMDWLRDSEADAPGDLHKAVLGSKWSWADKPNDKGVQMTFREDGTVSHIGMHGTWETTGPRDVTITVSDGAKVVLRFDVFMKSYYQVGGKIHGRIWP